MIRVVRIIDAFLWREDAQAILAAINASAGAVCSAFGDWKGALVGACGVLCSAITMRRAQLRKAGL